MQQSLGEVEFGFVPRTVVSDLQDIGNWKSRANAIDQLQRALRDVGDRSQILPGLPRFVSFLVQLVSDPNFKIAVSSMQILGDLVSKVGRDIEPQLKTIIPTLVEKFNDTKVLVRSANMKVLKKLMAATSARAVLELLGTGMSHTSWRVREEVLNTLIMALLQHSDSLDTQRAFKILAGGMTDPKEQVKSVALEGMAVLGKVMGAAEVQSMMRGGLPESLRSQVAARMANPVLPTVNLEGIVEHSTGPLPGDSLDAISSDISGLGRPRGSTFVSSTTTSANSRLPWEVPSQRPRLRTTQDALGVLDAVPDQASGGYSGSGGGFGGAAAASLPPPPPMVSVGSSLSSASMGLAPIRVGASGMFGRYGAGAAGQSGHYGGAADPPWGVASSPGGIASLGGGTGVRPSRAAPVEASTISDGNGSNSSSSGGVLGRSAGPGSAAASSSINGSINMNGLAALKHHRELAVSRSVELAGGSRGAGISPDVSTDAESQSPLTPSRGYKALITGASNREEGAGGLGAVVSRFHLPAGSGCSTLTQQPSGALSGDSILDGALGMARDRTSNPLRSSQPNAPTSTHNPGMGLWLQTNLEQEHAARQETFSPSKVELLANLKRRQIEKRANSAQLPIRPGGIDSSGEAVPGSPVWPLGRKESIGSVFDAGEGSGGGHYGLGSAGLARRSLFNSQQDSQLTSAAPKGTYVTSVGPSGILGSRALQPSNSGGHGTSASAFALAANAALGSGSGAYTEDMALTGARRLMNRPSRGAPSPVFMDPSSEPVSGSGQPALGSPSTQLASALARLTPNLENRMRARSAEIGGGGGGANGPSSAPMPAPHPHPPPVPRPAGYASAFAAGAGLATVSGAGSSYAGSNAGSAGPGTPLRSAPSAGSFWEKGMKPLEELAAVDLNPVPDPERTLRSVVAKLIEVNNADRKELDWQGQYEALNDARRLVKHHPDTVRASLHEFLRAAVPSIDQLRSFCVKNAITLFQEMFVSLGKSLDRELDEVVPLLLKKAGEVSNAGRENFLAAEADRALAEMWRTCSETRSIPSLCACANHKSTHVRGKVASHLDGLLEAAGPSIRGILTGSGPLLDKLFRTAVGFLDEGALEARTYGKRIVWHIKGALGSSEFERLRALVHGDALCRKLNDVVDGLNGPPPPPSRGFGASRAVSRQLSGGDSRGSPGSGVPSPGAGVLSGRALQDAHDESAAGWRGGKPGAPAGPGGYYSASAPSGDGRTGSTPERRRLQQIPSWRTRAAGVAGTQQEDGAGTAGGGGGAGGGYAAQHAAMVARQGSFGAGAAEALSKVLGDLTNKDFRERLEALRTLEGMAVGGQLAGAPEAQMVQLLDSMTARLGDGNAKVAVAACEVLGAMFGALRERVAPGLNTLVPALAAALGSANDKVRAVAAGAADALLASVDAALLVQNFSHCVSNGHLRGKPLLVERLQSIAAALWPGRPQLVLKHVLPATFSLLQDTKGEGKAAAQQLLATLAQLMGRSLLDHTATLQPAAQQRVADAVAAAGY